MTDSHDRSTRLTGCVRDVIVLAGRVWETRPGAAGEAAEHVSGAGWGPGWACRRPLRFVYGLRSPGDDGRACDGPDRRHPRRHSGGGGDGRVVRNSRSAQHNLPHPAFDDAASAQRGGGAVRLGDDDDADRAGAGGVCCAVGAVRGDQGPPGELDGCDANTPQVVNATQGAVSDAQLAQWILASNRDSLWYRWAEANDQSSLMPRIGEVALDPPVELRAWLAQRAVIQPDCALFPTKVTVFPMSARTNGSSPRRVKGSRIRMYSLALTRDHAPSRPRIHRAKR